MAVYQAAKALPDGGPGPWGDPVTIEYERRDVLLYAVGIGTTDLRFVYEGHSGFSVFPTFSIRWGGAGAPVDTTAVPSSPGPLNIDADDISKCSHRCPRLGKVQSAIAVDRSSSTWQRERFLRI